MRRKIVAVDESKEKAKAKDKDKEKDKDKDPSKEDGPQIILAATSNAAKVIIVHPGSYNLRIGLASESSPHVVPHIIARKIYNPQAILTVTPPPPLAPAAMSVKMTAIKSIKQSLEVLTEGTEAPNEYAEPIYTESTCATPLHNVPEWTDTSQSPSYLVGEDALNLSPTDRANYVLVRPLRSTSISPTPKYSHAAICNDLQTIWTQSIIKKLGIAAKEFGNYNVCLVIPDSFYKSEIKDLLNILLRDMGFRAGFVALSSVCATVGAGLLTACVVDVGHSRTSVCCVDDGVALIATRRMAPYGFSDVARLAGWLLRQPTYPHYFPPLPYHREEYIMQELIENHATLIPELVHATKTFEFKHHNASHALILYHASIHDVASIAPMGLFFPEAMKPLSCEVEKETNNNADNQYNNYYSNYDDPSDLYDDPLLLEGNNPSARMPHPEIEHCGLDLIVTNSILAIGKEMGDKSDLKRKLYGSVLLTGGASRLPGLESLLEDRLFDRLPPALEVERVEVVPSSLEAKLGSGLGYRDPGLRGDFLAWRGGAIISNLEGTKEMWFKKEEWDLQGIATLRERLHFGPL